MINVSDDKIINIIVAATLNSSVIVSTIDFYNYGVTTLEEYNNQEENKEIIKKINCVKDEVGIYNTTITLGNGISDKVEIVMMFNGEKGSPVNNNKKK